MGEAGTVLIADADAKTRSLVSDLLERASYSTVTVGDGDEALAESGRNRLDLAVLDVELPGLSGYELCRTLKEERGDGLAVILISGSRTEPFDRAAGLLIGADDYVTKPFDEGELLARVRRCIDRALLIRKSAGGPPPPTPYGLSPRELEVLSLLANGIGTTQIAQQLVISPKTVATHVQRILAKLGVHGRGEAIAIAYREGLTHDVETRRSQARSAAERP